MCNMEIGRCEKSGLTPPYLQPREPVVKYLPAHCLTDLVRDLGVHVGIAVYDGIWMYIVG